MLYFMCTLGNAQPKWGPTRAHGVIGRERVLHRSRGDRGALRAQGTKRRKTTHATGKERSTAQKKQVDDGSGRGRVALENTIVVAEGCTYNEWRGKARTEEMQDGRPGNLGS